MPTSALGQGYLVAPGKRHGNSLSGFISGPGNIADTKSVEFNGTYNATVSNSFPAQTAAITISAWVKCGTQSIGTPIISQLDLSGHFAWNFGSDGGNASLFRFVTSPNGSTGTLTVTTSSKVFDNNAWHHLVAVFDGANQVQKIYIDGVLDGITATGYSALYATPPAMVFGGGNAGTPFYSGSMDWVSVYGAALSQSDITALYNSGAPPENIQSLPSDANGIGFWPMGEKTDDTTTIHDLKNGYDATFSATAAYADVAFLVSKSTNLVANAPAMFLIDGQNIYLPDDHSGTHTPSSFDAPDLWAYTFTSSTSVSSLGNLPTQNGGTGPYFLIKEGNIGYLIYDKDETFLRVLDMSDLANISVIGSVSDTLALGTVASGVKNGNYIYVPVTKTDTLWYIEIVDVSTPESPTIVNTISASVGGFGIAAISGNYLFVGGVGTKGFQIFDISGANATNPVSKAVVTTLSDGVLSFTFDPDGTHVYITEGNQTTTGFLEVVDYSNVNAPTIVKTLTTAPTAATAALHPTRKLLLLPCWDAKEILIYSISDPPNTVFNSSYPMPNDSHGLQLHPQWAGLKGDLFYLAADADTGVGGNFYGYLNAYQLRP